MSARYAFWASAVWSYCYTREKNIRLKAKKKNRLLGWQCFKTTHSLSSWSCGSESQHKLRQQSQGERWGRPGCVATWPHCAMCLAGEPASATSGDASSSEGYAQLLLDKTYGELCSLSCFPGTSALINYLTSHLSTCCHLSKEVLMLSNAYRVADTWSACILARIS